MASKQAIDLHKVIGFSNTFHGPARDVILKPKSCMLMTVAIMGVPLSNYAKLTEFPIPHLNPDSNHQRQPHQQELNFNGNSFNGHKSKRFKQLEAQQSAPIANEQQTLNQMLDQTSSSAYGYDPMKLYKSIGSAFPASSSAAPTNNHLFAPNDQRKSLIGEHHLNHNSYDYNNLFGTRFALLMESLRSSIANGGVPPATNQIDGKMDMPIYHHMIGLNNLQAIRTPQMATNSTPYQHQQQIQSGCFPHQRYMNNNVWSSNSSSSKNFDQTVADAKTTSNVCLNSNIHNLSSPSNSTISNSSFRD